MVLGRPSGVLERCDRLRPARIPRRPRIELGQPHAAPLDCHAHDGGSNRVAEAAVVRRDGKAGHKRRAEDVLEARSDLARESDPARAGVVQPGEARALQVSLDDAVNWILGI
jgi:hypothetical protein